MLACTALHGYPSMPLCGRDKGSKTTQLEGSDSVPQTKSISYCGGEAGKAQPPRH